MNVIVPSSSGVRIDTQLEDPLSTLTSAGVTYATYLDYSRGRTILHTVRMNPLSSSGVASLAQASDLSVGVNLQDSATAQNSLIINGAISMNAQMMMVAHAQITDDRKAISLQKALRTRKYCRTQTTPSPNRARPSSLNWRTSYPC